MIRRKVARQRPRVVHITTTDMSLDWLLGPQLRAFDAAGYEVIGMSAAGPQKLKNGNGPSSAVRRSHSCDGAL